MTTKTLTPDEVPTSIRLHKSGESPKNASYWRRMCQAVYDQWQSDRDEIAAAKARIGELESHKESLLETIKQIDPCLYEDFLYGH